MKTKAELDAIKKEVEALSKKLDELADDELEQVTAGAGPKHHLIPIILGTGLVAGERLTADGKRKAPDVPEEIVLD